MRLSATRAKGRVRDITFQRDGMLNSNMRILL
jgi:hypothetical protein